MIDTQSTAGPIVGAAVAGAAGVILAADMKKNMNEAMRSTEQGFAPIEKSSNLYQQLDTERKIAELYMYRLNKR
jgi:gas vesicle protein